MPTIEDGRTAIAQGNLQGARLIFEAILQEQPRNEDAWLGLAEVLTDPEDKRICYENVLKINKNNQAAKEGLRNLEPKADPLVAALAPQLPPEEMVEGAAEDEADATLISARTDFVDTAGGAEDGPSTAALVALGLALSVVVFAVGGSVVYFILTSLVGP